MRKEKHRTRLIIGCLALVAAMLAAAPWWLRFDGGRAPLASATILAALLIIAAGLALRHHLRAAASLALSAGAWSMLSPILFGFWDLPAAFWSHVLAGWAAAIIAVWETDEEERDRAARQEPPGASVAH
jgi:hypothetical protein